MEATKQDPREAKETKGLRRGKGEPTPPDIKREAVNLNNAIMKCWFFISNRR